MLYPYRKDGTIELPAGSFFVRYLFNRVEQYYPFADNMKPMSKFIFWAIFRFETWFSRPPRIVNFIKFFFNIISKAHPIEKEWKNELDIRHAKELQAQAHASGISLSTIHELRKLWALSALHNCSKWKLIFRFFNNSKLDSSYYFKKAADIQKLLGVRYVVFGHTHEADICSFKKDSDGRKSEYVNSGTWTKTFSANYEEALLKNEYEFVFVNIRYSEAKKDIKMELLRWNDAIKEGERVRLFEKPSN